MEQAKFEAALIQELSLILNEPIDLTSDLPGDYGLDSFGTMQVIVFLEDNYDIEVPEDKFDMNNFASAQTIVHWALPMVLAALSQ